MNTSQIYVEPVLIGAFALIVFALPFAPETGCLIEASGSLQLPGGIALGAVIVGFAYVIGILTDRLIDNGCEALERHNRVSFAIGELHNKGRRAWDADPWLDPYPEDQYRFRVMTEANEMAQFLAYVRTRLRLMRALAFLLPAALYGGTVAVLRLDYRSQCLPDAATVPKWCGDLWHAFPIQPRETDPSRWWVWLVPLAVAYTFIWLLGLLAQWPDRWREARMQTTKFKSPSRFSLVRAGRWRPPRTDNAERMRRYAKERGVFDGASPNCRLAGDIILQPITIMSGLLMLFALVLALRAPGQPGATLAVGAGALVELAAGWAWWRITGTFMTYMRDCGVFLTRRDSAAAGGKTTSP